MWNCKTCRYWYNGNMGDPLQGLCRRYPPKPIDSETSIYPNTNADDKCGEYK